MKEKEKDDKKGRERNRGRMYRDVRLDMSARDDGTSPSS